MQTMFLNDFEFGDLKGEPLNVWGWAAGRRALKQVLEINNFQNKIPILREVTGRSPSPPSRRAGEDE